LFANEAFEPLKVNTVAPVLDLISFPETCKSPAIVTSDPLNVIAVLPPLDLISFPPTVKSPPSVTSLGKPIVIVCPETDVSTSLVVPITDNVWVNKLTEPVPVSPLVFKLETNPVNPAPLPTNEPLNEPLADVNIPCPA